MRAVFLRWPLRGERRRKSEVGWRWRALRVGLLALWVGLLALWVGAADGSALRRWRAAGRRPGYFSDLAVRRVHMRSSWASGMLLAGMDALADSSSMT